MVKIYNQSSAILTGVSKPMKDEFLQNFAQKLFEKCPTTRFLCITDDLGKVLTSVFGPSSSPLLSDEEIEHHLLPWVIQTVIGNKYENIRGKMRYTVVVYEHVIAVAIAVGFGNAPTVYIMMTFPEDEDVRSVIERQMIPMIEENKDYLM